MKQSLMKILTVLIILFITVSGAYSASLQKQWIPSDSKWIIHLDLESLFKTKTWSVIYEKREHKMDIKINRLYEDLKIDIFKDLKSVTLFGNRDVDKDAVILARGNFNKDTILNRIGKEKYFKIIKSGGHKIYKWDDDAFGAFLGRDMILFGHHENTLRNIIGKKKGDLRRSPIYSSIKKIPGNTFLYAIFGDFSLFEKKHKNPFFLKNAKKLQMLASETSGILNLSLNLTTESMEKAKSLMQVVNGIVALVKLSKDNKELSEATKFLDMLNMSVKGNSIIASLSIPSEELRKLPRKYHR